MVVGGGREWRAGRRKRGKERRGREESKTKPHNEREEEVEEDKDEDRARIRQQSAHRPAVARPPSSLLWGARSRPISQSHLCRHPNPPFPRPRPPPSPHVTLLLPTLSPRPLSRLGRLLNACLTPLSSCSLPTAAWHAGHPRITRLGTDPRSAAHHHRSPEHLRQSIHVLHSSTPRHTLSVALVSPCFTRFLFPAISACRQHE